MSASPCCKHIGAHLAAKIEAQGSSIPLVDLKRNYAAIQGEIDSAMAEVLANTAFIGGSHVDAFESAFATMVGVKHCIGCNSGTDALFLALWGLGVGPGDEVRSRPAPISLPFARAPGSSSPAPS